MADIDVAKHWNDNADQWARDVRAGFDVYRDQFTFPAFLDALPPINGLDVIDFGCGEGTNTRAFARLGARVTGIDLSARMIEHARKTEEADPLGIGYHVTSYSDHCGMPDASYDAVLSTMALMDGPDLPGTMQEAHRLLRPGDGRTAIARSAKTPGDQPEDKARCHVQQRWEYAARHERAGLSD